LTTDLIKEIILKPITKVIIVIVAVAAVAGAIIFAQVKLRGSDSFTTISAAELTSLADTLPDSARRQLAQNKTQREELIKTIKKLYALAQAAQAEGKDRADEYKQQNALQTDLLLASEESKRNPQETIPKEETKAYLTAHQKEFDADIKMVNAGSKQEIPPDQIEPMKDQWAETKVRAERARKAGIDKEATMPIQLKLRRAQVLAQLYTKALQEKFKPTPEELKKYYADHPEADMDRVKKKAEDILARVKKGEDFATLAKEYSDDKGSGEKGGLVTTASGEEWVAKGSWVPEFEKAAFSLPPGQTSDLVKSGYGYHIIRVDDRRTVEKKADEAKPAADSPDAGGAKDDKGPKEEIKVRHILISTRDAEGADQLLAQKKVEREVDSATLKYPVTAPADFTINVAGTQANPNLRLPNLGGGPGGRMAPITPNK